MYCCKYQYFTCVNLTIITPANENTLKHRWKGRKIQKILGKNHVINDPIVTSVRKFKILCHSTVQHLSCIGPLFPYLMKEYSKACLSSKRFITEMKERLDQSKGILWALYPTHVTNYHGSLVPLTSSVARTLQKCQ